MESLRHKSAIALLSLCFMAGLAIMPVSAQDATPADVGDCVTSTPEENVASVEALIAATDANDEEALHALLADDLVYELDRYGLEHDPQSNDDEVAMIALQEEMYPGSVTTIHETVAAGDTVAAHQILSIDGHMLTGEHLPLGDTLEVKMIIIYTFECGLIAHMHGVVDEYALFTGLGLMEPLFPEEATPAP